jgi:hypothetical protein
VGINPTPSGQVQHGTQICYTVCYGAQGAPLPCDIVNFDSTLILPNGVSRTVTTNASISANTSFCCPSADPRCVLTSPNNCYVVSHDDEVTSFSGCPPVPSGDSGRVVAYTFGAGDTLTELGDAVAPCATANNIVAHGSCCDPCTGECVSQVTCNECPGDRIFTLGGTCSGSCLLTCGDADACTTDGVCVPGSGRNNCATTPGGTPATCSPNVHFCDVPPPDFTCDDRNECTSDICLDDTDPNNPCCSNEPIVCPPVPCMRNTGCNPASGCTYTPDCREGTGCCPADSDQCDTESCDPSTGICGSSPICEKGEVCCANGESCDDGNECTEDVCTEGCCENRPIVCDDGNACTTDRCDPAAGCIYTPIVCDDQDACTTDACIGGICVYTEIVCDDGDSCTIDVCVDGTCRYTPIACDDGDDCTKDFCKDGKCEHVDIVCDDKDDCTTDVCVDGTCRYTPIACDDGDDCTKDFCKDGKCVYVAINCDDNDACTTDFCKDGECKHIEKDCDDNDPCTADTCEDGRCENNPIEPPPAGCAGGDGCTPGFWRQPHHFQYWVGYTPSDLFDTVFGVTSTFPANTLLEVVVQGGGGEKALGRHAVAALLNSTNPDVDYAYETDEVIAMVQAAYASGDFEGVKNRLETENERGCTVDKDRENDDDGDNGPPKGPGKRK